MPTVSVSVRPGLQGRELPAGFGLGEETSGDPFMVVGLHGNTRLEITVGSAVAAATAAWYWQSSGLHAEWCLRGDVTHERPVLLFTQADDGTVHATPLVPGTPVSSHLLTSCGARLESTRVCSNLLAAPCASCHRSFTRLYRAPRDGPADDPASPPAVATGLAHRLAAAIPPTSEPLLVTCCHIYSAE